MTSASNAALYHVTGGQGGTVARIAVKGAAATGLAGGVTFSTFSAVVHNRGDQAAFMARAVGGGLLPPNDIGLWNWDGAALSHLAQISGTAAGCGGATWAGFGSLALPDAGRPLFLGTLAAGTGTPAATTSTDSGLWGVDAGGAVQLAVREGVTTVDARTVKSFKVLGAVVGSPAQTRSHNAAGKVVLWVSFTDGTQGIVTLDTP